MQFSSFRLRHTQSSGAQSQINRWKGSLCSNKSEWRAYRCCKDPKDTIPAKRKKTCLLSIHSARRRPFKPAFNAEGTLMH